MTTTSKKKKPRQKSLKKQALTKSSKPDKLTLRSYQVGFGDCFLLTFHYGTQGRHVLIDFGSTGLPDGTPKDWMLRVAEDIKVRCHGKLHVLVATHRHKDHISGFATDGETNSAGKTSGDIILSCEPDVIIQPWTEDPDAHRDAKKATSLPSEKSIPFTQTLLDMQAFALAVKEEADKLNFSDNKRLIVEQLRFLGEDNIRNRSAVENLIAMGQRKGARPMYVFYDFDNPLRLKDVLPGVTVRVLGPPTLQQSDKITKMRPKDEAEFWQLHLAAARPIRRGSNPLFSDVATQSAQQLMPPYTRWFIRRMDALHDSQLVELLGIVRILDSVMNNTSVILLFEAGDKKLLFPGDAQIENWSYALEQAETNRQLRELLESVDVFKVGHHGSRNANPKSLWKMFKNKNTEASPTRLQTFVSTMEGKHGDPDPEKRTEVPRTTLVKALKKMSTYFSTQELTKDGALSKSFTLEL